MKKIFNNFYLVGAGGYGKQLSTMLTSNKIIKSPIFVDDKIKFNINKFFCLKNKVNYSIFIGKPKRETIFNYLTKKKIFFIQL